MKKTSLCALIVLLMSLSAVAATNDLSAREHLKGSVVSSNQLSHVVSQANPGEGDPMPTCYPGKNCGGNQNLRIIAGEGDPMPTCYPGKNCGGNDQLRIIAGEGDPLPTCYPGKNCGGNQNMRLAA